MVEKSHTAGWLPNIYEPLKSFGEKIADWFAPRSEASADESFYQIDVGLPGVSPENVDVSIQNSELTVRGEKRFSREEQGRTFFFSEREYGAFQRSFRLPPDADANSVDASFKDGVLSIKIKKSDEGKWKERKIEISVD